MPSRTKGSDAEREMCCRLAVTGRGQPRWARPSRTSAARGIVRSSRITDQDRSFTERQLESTWLSVEVGRLLLGIQNANETRDFFDKNLGQHFFAPLFAAPHHLPRRNKKAEADYFSRCH